MQRSEVRGSRTAGTASALSERSYRTARLVFLNPETNNLSAARRRRSRVKAGTATRTDTDGHGRARTHKWGRWGGIVDAPAGRIGSEGDGTAVWRGQRSEVGGQGERNSRLERAEVRGQRSGKTRTAEQPFNAKGANETQTTQAIFWGRGAQAGAVGAKRSLKHTGARPVDGAGRGQRGSGTAGTAF